MVSMAYRRYVEMKSGLSQAPPSHAASGVDATHRAWEHIEQSTENSAETPLVASGTNSPNHVNLPQTQARRSNSQTTISPGSSQDNPIVLDEAHPNAPYYTQGISSSALEKYGETEDEQNSLTEAASPRSYLGIQGDPSALQHEPIDHNRSPIPQSSIDVSQPSTTAASHPKQPSRKRSRARPQPSPRLGGSITRPKRLCTTHRSAKATPVSFPRVQGWEVVDLVGVSVLDNGSAQCFLRWQETKIDEAEIKDEHLLGQFKGKFKQKYGEAAWRRWVGEKAVRGRRYGLD